MSNKVQITITDNSDKVVGNYTIFKETIASNARRLGLMQPFIDAEMDEFTKAAYFSAAALAPTLGNGKGEIIYKDSDAVEKIMEELDPDVFNILCQHYNEINPLSKGLKTKKKRS